jgi:hypothetical protein
MTSKSQIGNGMMKALTIINTPMTRKICPLRWISVGMELRSWGLNIEAIFRGPISEATGRALTLRQQGQPGSRKVETCVGNHSRGGGRIGARLRDATVFPRPRNSWRKKAMSNLTAHGSKKQSRKMYRYLYFSHCIQTLLIAALRVGYRVREHLFL